MKFHLRVPTEMYAYIEAEYEGDAEGAVIAYRQLTDLTRVKSGLPDKEFNGILDHYLSGKPFVGDEIMAQKDKMSPEQLAIVSAIKRSKARTK